MPTRKRIFFTTMTTTTRRLHQRFFISLYLMMAVVFHLATANNLHVANSIFENEPVGTEAADLDKMLHGSVYGIGDRDYQLVQTKVSGGAPVSEELFSLEGSRLAIRSPIDREALCPNANSCILETTIFVRQKEPRDVEFMLVLETTVRDINDNEPRFSNRYMGNVYRLNISEGDPVGSRYSLPEANDIDSDDFGIKNYSIEGSPDALSMFRLLTNSPSGFGNPTLELIKLLDREDTPNLQLRLVVFDKGNPALSSTLTVDIQVLDENDNTPQFEKMEYLESLQESYDLNGAVTNVRATDRDEGDNARVSYFVDDSANPTSERGMFVIPNPNVGQVRLAKALDYEQWPEHRFKIVAIDHGKIPRTGSTLVTIRVLDVNDQPPAVVTYPTIPNEANEVRVKENSPIHTAVAVIKIKDPSGAAGPMTQTTGKNVECHIQEQEISRSFYLAAIEKGSEYILKTNGTFDREIRPSITVQIQCVNLLDAGSRLATNRDIVVHILDENDNAPIFEQGSYQVVSFLENSPPGTTVHKFLVADVDATDNAEVSFSLSPPDDSTEAVPFAINNKMGVLKVTDILDREKKESYVIKVIAHDSGLSQLSSTATLVVNLIDENDNPPKFERPVYNFLIPQDVEPRYRITQFSVHDPDAGENAIVSMGIDNRGQSSFPPAYFSVDTEGVFYVNERIPPKLWSTEQPVKPLEVKVVAADNGAPKRESVALSRLYLVNKSDSSLLLLFPTKNNFTLPVSISLLKTALGLSGDSYQNRIAPPAIGRVVAVTDDNFISQGAFLSYELLNSNNNQPQTVAGASPILFRINKTTGDIYIDTAAMAAASQKQEQVPVVVNPGDRYSLAVVIRLSVPPFNKSFAIERFNRLDVVFHDEENMGAVFDEVSPSGATISGDLRNIGLVIGLASFAGVTALLVLFLVVLCRKNSRSASRRSGFLHGLTSGILGQKALHAGNGQGVVGSCATGNSSPCGSQSSSKTSSDTKPLSVDIMGCGHHTTSTSASSSITHESTMRQVRSNSNNSQNQNTAFENSIFPVERLKLSCNRIDEEITTEKTEYTTSTLRRPIINKSAIGQRAPALLVGVATPRMQPHLTGFDGGSPALLEQESTSPALDNMTRTGPHRAGNECSSSSIVSNSSTNSAISTGISSAGSGPGHQQQPSSNGSSGDRDSGRGTEEPPPASAPAPTTPSKSILVGIMKSPMPPPRPSGIYGGSGTVGNCDKYHVYPRIPPEPHRSQQYRNETDESMTAAYRLPTTLASGSVNSSDAGNGGVYFSYNNRQHHSEHYLMDDKSDDVHLPNSASGGCPVHGADPSVTPGAPAPPPPFRSCPVHGIVIPAGQQEINTFSPTSILRNSHSYQHQHQQQPQQHHIQYHQHQQQHYTFGGVNQQPAHRHIQGTML